MRRLVDAVLTTDPALRGRLTQLVTALAMMAAGVLTMQYFVWIGTAPANPVRWWTVVCLVAMALAYLAVRSGWSKRFGDPAMTVPQMLGAITGAVAAYAMLGPARGGVFLVVMAVLMFGMFAATPRQVRWVTLYAVLVFGVVMAVMAERSPRDYPPGIEFGNFLMVATMMPAMSLLAGRIGEMRLRARRQRQDLAQALARIRELATRDELTGLINRRHMRQLMEQEHQRCVRSGHTFCLAVLDIDQFRQVNDQHGRAIGDAVLRSVAHEAMRRVRVSDVFSRWEGDRFVLLLSDTRAALARGGVERVRLALSEMRVAVPAGQLHVSLSAGMAEHHAGETVEQTLERAERALDDAKAQGRDRFVAAG